MLYVCRGERRVLAAGPPPVHGQRAARVRRRVQHDVRGRLQPLSGRVCRVHLQALQQIPEAQPLQGGDHHTEDHRPNVHR